jgi:hypothetical protein
MIVCDLKPRRAVTLLPDREIAAVEAWLRIILRSRLCHAIVAADMGSDGKRLAKCCSSR